MQNVALKGNLTLSKKNKERIFLLNVTKRKKKTICQVKIGKTAQKRYGIQII